MIPNSKNPVAALAELDTRSTGLGVAAPSLGDLAPGHVAVIETPHGRFELTVRESGPVGAAFDQLTYATTTRSDWDTPALTRWAHALTQRITYLMEPLRILEIDTEDRHIELRSPQPTQRQGGRFYYQALLDHSGLLTLKRFRFDEADRKRDQVPMQLTRETLERLMEDCVLAATSIQD